MPQPQLNLWTCGPNLRLEFFIIQVHSQSITNSEQISVVFCQLVDGLNLLAKVMSFKEITEMRVIVGPSNFVHIQQSLSRAEHQYPIYVVSNENLLYLVDLLFET